MESISLEKHWKLAVLLVVGLGALALFFVLTFPTPFDYHVVEEEVDFYSNAVPPGDLLNGISQQKQFVLVHSFHETGSLNAFMSQSLNIFQAVLTANKKQVWVVAHVVGENEELVRCQTDYGTGKASESLSAEECASYLTSLNGVVVRVHTPNTVLRRPKVVLSPMQLDVWVAHEQELPGTSFLIAKTLFSNALAAINAANQGASVVSGASG
ncbi:MAG: hypothetical protein HY393_02335 [Candidatus Diapherotrites archaeon]|nr:hypothetical protein [Candidatus Diapherotrites archaeon]